MDYRMQKISEWVVMKTYTVSVCVGIFLLMGIFSVEAATFYKYTDENGTIVFTEELEEIPFDLRDSAEKIIMAVEESEKKRSELIPENITDQIKNNPIAEKNIRQGKEVLASFLKDQKFLVIGYVVGGILLFIMLTSVLKRFAGGFLTKIVVNLVIVVVLFSGGYFFYLSWINKTVLGFGQDSSDSTSLADQITTPKEILEKTKATVDQMNANSEARKKVLDGLN